MLSFRNLWVRKTRTVITIIGVMLGVTALYAVSVMIASTNQSLRNFFAQSSGRADLTITDAGTSGEGMPHRILYRAQNIEGIAQAVGVSSNNALFLGKDGQYTLTVMGIDPEQDPHLRTYKMTVGRFLDPRERTHSIVLVDKFAIRRRIALDDAISLTLPNGSQEQFRVIGLLADEGAGHLASGQVGFVTLETAQNVFERGSRLDSIDLVAEPQRKSSPTALKELKQRIADELGNKYVVAFPAATGESVSQALSSFNVGMAMFSIIALFVGMLLIYNTFAMTIAERTRETGLLRALGATRRQVLLLVLSEAVFLGVLGSALGIAGGLLLSIPLVNLMGAVLGLPLEEFAIPADAAVQAIVVGLVTTLVAALLPAWQASRVSPTAALRARAGGGDGFLLRHGWKIGLVFFALALLDKFDVLRLNEGSFFLIFIFLGAILVTSNFIMLAERAVRWLFVTIYGPMGQLGSRNLARAKGRTTLTVGVLMIGVVMTVSIGAMSVSFKASMDDWVNAALGGDFIISGYSPMRDDVVRDLADVEGIAAVTPERWLNTNISGVVRGGIFEVNEDPVVLIGVDPVLRRNISSFQFLGSEDADTVMADLERGDVIFLSGVLRDRWHVQRGDSVRLRTGRGEHDFRIAAAVSSFVQGGYAMYIGRHDIEKYYGDHRISLVMAKKQPDVPSAEVEARLKDGIARSRHLRINSGDQYRQSIASQIQQFFMMFDAMVWIAIIVGALGVMNTMTMNVLERVREIGTLRSIGMTRWQLAWMILAEAGALGVLGSLLGILVALPTAREGVARMAEGSGFTMTYLFPGSAFVAAVATALVISQLAALYPTFRAGRINVIEAIKDE